MVPSEIRQFEFEAAFAQPRKSFDGCVQARNMQRDIEWAWLRHDDDPAWLDTNASGSRDERAHDALACRLAETAYAGCEVPQQSLGKLWHLRSRLCILQESPQ